MRRELTVEYEFVELIPDELKEKTLYISIAYATVVHKCFCGCGHEVVTPLSPTDWKLIFDGQSISLYPSIGNWNLPCQSHYWVDNNRIQWARRWSQQEIAAGRACDALMKQRYYNGNRVASIHTIENNKPKESFWQKLKWW